MKKGVLILSLLLAAYAGKRPPGADHPAAPVLAGYVVTRDEAYGPDPA